MIEILLLITGFFGGIGATCLYLAYYFKDKEITVSQESNA